MSEWFNQNIENRLFILNTAFTLKIFNNFLVFVEMIWSETLETFQLQLKNKKFCKTIVSIKI